MADLGKLAAGFAHEINNPMGALKSTADVSARCVSKMEQLLEGGEDPAAIRGATDLQDLFRILRDNNEVFFSASDRITNTVRNFVNFTRLDGAEFGRIDLHEAIDNTLTLMQHELGTGISAVKEYGDIPEIACFPGELNQVFLNLLTNAALAIKEEGKVTVRTFAGEGTVSIQITDTGVGIPPDQIQGLFDPRFTRDGTRLGADMGLFASHSIVQKHRGRIEVESAVGKGSTFTVILPADLESIIETA